MPKKGEICMPQAKYLSLARREAMLKESQTLCETCKKRQAIMHYRKKPICGECLNPDTHNVPDYAMRLLNYWIEPKSSMQQVCNTGGWRGQLKNAHEQ